MLKTLRTYSVLSQNSRTSSSFLMALRGSIYIAFIVVLTSIVAHGQEPLGYSDQAEQVFQRALELYRAQRFAAATASFDTVGRVFPLNQRTTAALVMQAKSLLLADEPVEAAQVLKRFLANHPSSTYAADAQFTLGIVYSKGERFDDALQLFLEAWRNARLLPASGVLAREIVDALDVTIDKYQASVALQALLKQSSDPTERAYLWLKLAEKEISQGNVAAAAVASDTLMAYYPRHPYQDRLAALRTRVAQRSTVKLGVLLPISKTGEPSPAKEIGAEIQNGITLALEQEAKRPEARVTVVLEAKDTELDPQVTARGMQELAADENVIGVIGPIFSANALQAAAVANIRNVCLVSPTANANGIAATGPYVFQANPDFEHRGRAMARYAVRTRGMKTLAILVSTEGNGRFMADAFLKEATDLGARVIATELYERGASDLKVQLGNIRRAGLLETSDPLISFAGKVSRADIARLVQLGVPAGKIDSLIERSSVIRASRLLGPQAKRKIDSLGIRTMIPFVPLDSLAIPVTTIDGIYVPITSSDEIGIVSSQLVYFNLQAQVLGSGEWNNLPELSAQKRYSTGVIFESESYVDERDSSYLEVSRRYSERFGRRPTKYVFFGYDTAQLLYRLIQKGGASRDGLARALKSTENFQGLHAKISFPPGRVNPWLHILRFDGERVEHIGEVNSQPGKF